MRERIYRPPTRRGLLVAAVTGVIWPKRAGAAMTHVVLLGDSVFDNGAYVGGAPDVAEQLRAVMPGGTVTLLAQDGAVTDDVLAQVKRIPEDATHIVISAGGNDALGVSGILQERAGSVAEVLLRFSEIQERFGGVYGRLLDAAAERKLPVATSTIYDPRYEDMLQRRLGRVGLFVFNDVITRQAFSRGIGLLDLRLICGEDADFANPVEPSEKGGRKIAEAIARFAVGTSGASAVFAR